MPYTFDAEDVLNGTKTAILVPAVIHDLFQAHEGGDWHSIDDLELGSSAYAVNHYGRHSSTQGGLFEVKSIATPARGHVQIMSIHLVRADLLTQAELDELGYDPAHPVKYGVNWREAMGQRRAWFMRVIPVDPASPVL